MMKPTRRFAAWARSGSRSVDNGAPSAQWLTSTRGWERRVHRGWDAQKRVAAQGAMEAALNRGFVFQVELVHDALAQLREQRAGVDARERVGQGNRETVDEREILADGRGQPWPHQLDRDVAPVVQRSAVHLRGRRHRDWLLVEAPKLVLRRSVPCVAENLRDRSQRDRPRRLLAGRFKLWPQLFAAR